MMMWMMIMYATLFATAVALLYVSSRVCKFGDISRLCNGNKKGVTAVGIIIVFLLFALVGYLINFMNAIVCVVYFAMIWAVCDLVFAFIVKIRKQNFAHYYSGIMAVVLSVAALAWGWYLNHNVWQTTYNLVTGKNIENIKIVMFADSHTGTTFKAEGFAKHIAAMQKQNPDMVVVVGDYVDDDTTKEDMIATSKALGSMKTKYGVYFVFGNHDEGYYGPAHRGFSGHELVQELENNGVIVLSDEVALVNDMFYVIGRKDFSEEKEKHKHRKSMQELVKELDNSKYMIVLDHQPADYAKQAEAGVDLVLSGHTHGGQLFPFNNVGKWIGANDRIYGYEKRLNTDFIVTSGLSDWAIKFKTGTKSEYVVINLQKEP